MIDPKDLAKGIRRLEESSLLSAEPPCYNRAVIAAAKAYQSAVASKDEVSAATMAYVQTKDATPDSYLMSDCVFDYAIRAALTAAKIKVAHRVNVDTLAGFDGGFDAGWREAIEAAIITVNDHLDGNPVNIAKKLADLNPHGE